jgi:hypothetical protein
LRNVSLLVVPEARRFLVLVWISPRDLKLLSTDAIEGVNEKLLSASFPRRGKYSASFLHQSNTVIFPSLRSMIALSGGSAVIIFLNSSNSCLSLTAPPYGSSRMKSVMAFRSFRDRPAPASRGSRKYPTHDSQHI